MRNEGTARQTDDADDLRAVQETLRGDAAAFERIVDRYTPVIYALSLRYLGREEEAEDAVQEVFLRAYDALARFRIERRFYSWIYTIAINHLRNARGKRIRRGTDRVLPFEDRAATGSVRTPLADPQRELERSEGVSLVHSAIDRLPPRYRDVLILHQIEELPVTEVSQILGLPEGTVKTHLFRARRALADFIAGIDEQPRAGETAARHEGI